MGERGTTTDIRWFFLSVGYASEEYFCGVVKALLIVNTRRLAASNRSRISICVAEIFGQGRCVVNPVNFSHLIWSPFKIWLLCVITCLGALGWSVADSLETRPSSTCCILNVVVHDTRIHVEIRWKMCHSRPVFQRHSTSSEPARIGRLPVSSY